MGTISVLGFDVPGPLPPAHGLTVRCVDGDATCAIPASDEALLDALAAASTWSEAHPASRWEVVDDEGRLDRFGLTSAMFVEGGLVGPRLAPIRTLLEAVRSRTGRAVWSLGRDVPPEPLAVGWSREEDPGHALADWLDSVSLTRTWGRWACGVGHRSRARTLPRVSVVAVLDDGAEVTLSTTHPGRVAAELPGRRRPAGLRVEVTPVRRHPCNGLATVDGPPGRAVSQLGRARVHEVSLRADGDRLAARVAGAVEVPCDELAWSVSGVVPGERSTRRWEVRCPLPGGAGPFHAEPLLDIGSPPRGVASWRAELVEPADTVTAWLPAEPVGQ